MAIIARLNGGMGNQMFQYAFATALAAKRGTNVKLDCSLFDLPQTPESYRLDEFDIEPSFTNAARNFFSRALLSPKLPPPFKLALGLILNTKVFAEYGPEPSSGGSILLNGYFQKPAFFAEHESKLRRTFAIAIKGDKAAQLQAEIAQARSVAVHVRRGDYANVAQFRERLGVLSREYYQTAILRIQAQVQDARFFFFSDDLHWVEENLLPFTSNGELVELGDEAKDSTEMTLMASCSHFIVANSTFSWWPAFLGGSDQKIVLAPEPWFRGEPEAGAALIMPDWHTLQPIWEE